MDRLHLAHTCTYDAGAVIKEAEALGELQQCQLLSQQQVRGNAAVLVAVTTAGQGNAAASVAVTTAGQGKCSSVGCCYNSRSGEMQQRRLLLQQQVGYGIRRNCQCEEAGCQSGMWAGTGIRQHCRLLEKLGQMNLNGKHKPSPWMSLSPRYQNTSWTGLLPYSL